MQLNEIHIDRLGVLENVSLDNIPGLSVVRGENRNSKTTLVRFLINTLLSADSLEPRDPEETHVGSVQISDLHHRWTMSRCQSVTGEHRTTVRCADNTDRDVPLKSCFPGWVSDQAFQEILCPGREDASQFTLLTQLCLDTNGAFEAGPDVRRVRRAMVQAARERAGTVRDAGLEQQIASLNRQRNLMKDQLKTLTQQGSVYPTKIAAIKDGISGIQDHGQQIDEKHRQIQTEFLNLEHRIGDLRNRNQQAIDQDQLRTLITTLAARRKNWIKIRSSIEEMTDEISVSDIPDVNRPRHSVQEIMNRPGEQTQRGSEIQTDRRGQNIDQEPTKLRRFATQQEAAGACEQDLESLFSAEACTAIGRMETLLQSRINTIHEELERAAALPKQSLHDQALDCSSAMNQGFYHDNRSSDQTLTSLEPQLHFLLQRHSSLLAESENNFDDHGLLTMQPEDPHSQLHPVPSLEEVDDLLARLAEIEARLDLLAVQHNILERTEYALDQVATRLSQESWPAALETASIWLKKLTDGECVEILSGGPRSELLVETKTSHRPMPVNRLSQEIQHQLALVLRLALLKVYSATSTRMPLVIDDVFIAFDGGRGDAVAGLLQDVAAGGQQIILMTCRNDVCELMEAHGAQVYTLAAAAPSKLAKPVSLPVFNAFADVAGELSGEPADEGIGEEQKHPHWLFYLEPDHPVSDLSGIEIIELKGFTTADFESIEQLITCPVTDVKERIHNAGFLTTADRLKELKGQALMAVCVPMLRQRDAELLVAAGIDSVRQLVRLRPEMLHEMIVRFQHSKIGTRFLQDGLPVDQQQAISWNRWALHARTVGQALNAAITRRSQISRSMGILSSSQKIRTDRRLTTVQRGEELKFFLSPSSGLEAAPSIGRDTAALLASFGVQTVHDLLESDTNTLASLLANHQITASIIEQWKSQSELVCTIPKLRSHDAQILVACGKNDVKEIVNLTPEQLFRIVGLFCETNEGEKVIGSGRKPNLKEVTEWISRARHSRPLKAA